MAFLEQFDDDSFGKNLASVFVIIALLVSVFLFASSKIDQSIFFYLIISAVIILIAIQLGNGLLQGNFLGSKSKFYTSLIVGSVLGIILGYAQRGGQLNLVLPVQALVFGDLTFLFVNIIAPIIEPLFWRGVIYPSVLFIFSGIFKNNKPVAILMALLVSGFGFGFYHVNTYFTQTGAFQPTFEAISFAALFGVLFTIGNSLAGSLGLEVGWHFANNLFSAGYPTDQIIPTIIFFGIVIVAISELVDRLKR